jgi:hypothetical protein
VNKLSTGKKTESRQFRCMKPAALPAVSDLHLWSLIFMCNLGFVPLAWFYLLKLIFDSTFNLGLERTLGNPAIESARQPKI